MEQVKKFTPYVVLVIMILIQYYFAYSNQIPVLMPKM